MSNPDNNNINQGSAYRREWEGRDDGNRNPPHDYYTNEDHNARRHDRSVPIQQQQQQRYQHSNRGERGMGTEYRYAPANGRRGRSRSRSPENTQSRKERFDAERKSRMTRLRAENDQEEEHIASLQNIKNNINGDHSASGKRGESKATTSFVQVKESELEGLDEEEQMRMLLGFSGGFGSTKGEKVQDNHNSSSKGACAKNKARKYRQYMNRKGGFNRPLEEMD